MRRTAAKIKLSTQTIALAAIAVCACLVGLGLFGYQIYSSVRSLVLIEPATTVKISACNAPLPIGSDFFQNWPLGPIDCSLRAFYMTNGLNNQSNGVITMSKQTDYIKSLADQIDTLATPHDTVQNIMAWMHDPNHGNIQGPGRPNCAGIPWERFAHTADEILTSRCALGCQEWTLAFVALARAKGIPAASVETVSDRWISESIRDGCMHFPKKGHVIADVYTGVSTNGGWELADPTQGYFTVYENNDFSGYALMRFNDYSHDDPTQPFGSGYRYRVFHRGIDSWDYGMFSDQGWTDAVIEEYGISANCCPGDCDEKSLENPDWLWTE